MQMKVPCGSGKFNSIGEDFEETEAMRQQLLESIEKRKTEIQTLIRDASDIGALDAKTFIFVSTLDFYSDSKSIYPAEIAFSKFSLKEGIIDAISIRINPGPLPMGSRYSAEVHAKATHKYPLPESDSADGETDYIEILMQIVEFLKSEKTMPIFWTEGNPDVSNQKTVFDNTTKVLKLIFDNAGEYEISAELKIYPIDELFFYLIKQLVEVKKLQDEDTDDLDSFSSIQFANDRFKRTDYDFAYIGSLSCDYHFEKDAVVNCCLSRVKRYGYIIAKWCSQDDKYEIREGHHYPKHCDIGL